MVVSIIPHDGRGPQGKMADAELVFTDGPLEGLKLIGFTLWEGRAPGKYNVTFPARQYSVNGERRSFALLRAVGDAAAVDRLRQVILDAYDEHRRLAVAS
jgi:broad specificity phosphatase PhoE